MTDEGWTIEDNYRYFVHPELPYELHPELVDFRKFFWLVLRDLEDATPSRLQLDWCHQIQANRGDLMIQAPRGEGKSMWVCIYVAWRLYLNPWITFIIASQNDKLAQRNSGYIKRIMGELEELKHLLPTKRHINNAKDWQTSYSPPGDLHKSVQCYGISSGIVGSHCHEAIGDDIEVGKNSATAIQREQLLARSNELYYLPMKDVEGTRRIWVGTPHTEETLYNTLTQRGCRVMIYPRQYGWKDDHYNGTIAPMLVEDRLKDPSLVEGGVFGLGKSTDPIRVPDEKLLKDAITGDSAGRSSWMLQQMLDPRAGLMDIYPLKLSDVIVTDVDQELGPDRIKWGTNPIDDDPARGLVCMGRGGDKWNAPGWTSDKFSKWDRKIAFVDPSGSGTDATSCAILYLLNGTLYLYRILHFSGGYDEETVLIPMAKALNEAGPLDLYYEANMGGSKQGSMFGSLLRPIIARYAPNVSFDEEDNAVYHTGQKERRIISTLEPVMNAHRLVISRKAIQDDHKFIQGLPAGSSQQYSAFYQMARLTDVKNCLGHDDGLDAIAGAVAVMQEFMAVDQDEAASVAHLERLHEEIYQQLLEHEGATPIGPNPGITLDDWEGECY